MSTKEQIARLDIAVRICISQPDAYAKATDPKYWTLPTVKEDISIELLRRILATDPAVRHELAFYMKRERS